MCLVIYAASSAPLPAVPWDEARPAFHVQPYTGERVLKHLTLPYQAFVGSSSHCGCEFGYACDVPADPEVLTLTEADPLAEHEALVAYFRPLVEDGAALELLSCWAGDEDEPIAVQYEIPLETLGRRAFVEGALYAVRSARA